MKEFNSKGRRINVVGAKETASWLQQIKPDVAATFTLLKAKRFEGSPGGIWLRGCDVEYDRAYRRLVHDLSRWHLGRAYRRYQKLIPNFASLEGDGEIKRHHIHAAFRCPEHADQEDFMQSIYDFWMAYSPWAMDDVLIEPIEADWGGYTIKEGSEALLLGGTSL